MSLFLPLEFCIVLEEDKSVIGEMFIYNFVSHAAARLSSLLGAKASSQVMKINDIQNFFIFLLFCRSLCTRNLDIIMWCNPKHDKGDKTIKGKKEKIFAKKRDTMPSQREICRRDKKRVDKRSVFVVFLSSLLLLFPKNTKKKRKLFGFFWATKTW